MRRESARDANECEQETNAARAPGAPPHKMEERVKRPARAAMREKAATVFLSNGVELREEVMEMLAHFTELVVAAFDDECARRASAADVAAVDVW